MNAEIKSIMDRKFEMGQEWDRLHSALEVLENRKGNPVDIEGLKSEMDKIAEEIESLRLSLDLNLEDDKWLSVFSK
jgi:hypothetical protein